MDDKSEQTTETSVSTLSQTKAEEHLEMTNATLICPEQDGPSNTSESTSDGDEIAQFVGVSPVQFLTNSNEPLTALPRYTNLTILPLKVLLVIFENLESQYRQVLLGLTCVRMYRVLKGIHPNPICPRNGPRLRSNNKIWQYGLEYHIGNFLGPAYRYRIYDRRFKRWDGNDVPFLLRQVYGDSLGDKEKELNERYHDWKVSTDLQFSGETESCLPHPFGKGDDWYFEARKWLEEYHFWRRLDYAGTRYEETKLLLYKKMLAEKSAERIASLGKYAKKRDV